LKPPRTFSGEVQAPPRPGPATAGLDARIQILEDGGGTIALGPVADDVIYVCFVDHVSAALATVCARRLRRLLARTETFALFVDAHDPESVELGARNEIVRCLFAHRQKLRMVVSLVRTPAVRASAAFVSHVLGCVECVTDDGDEFDLMLSALAPNAHERLAPANLVRAPFTERPRITLMSSG
jgi:hypothetical protein